MDMIVESMHNFHEEVRKLKSERNMDFIDAVIYWCELKGVEVELAADLINGDAAMLSNIQEEAENLNYLKKTARLPV
jgi:hypothetical protein